MRVTPIFCASFVVLVGACGGPTASAALGARVKDSHLAPVPLEQRQNVAIAQRTVFLAEWQVRFTQAEIDDAKVRVKVAKNDLAKAKLSRKSAKTRRKQAKKLADQKRIRSAVEQEKLADLEVEYAKAALASAKQEVKYLRKRLEAEQYDHRTAEAKVERLKGQAMVAAGIRPPGFSSDRYKDQYEQRSRLAKQAATRAASERRKLSELSDQSRQAKLILDRAQGPQGQAAAPQAPVAPEPPPPADESPPEEPTASPGPETPEPPPVKSEPTSTSPEEER